MEAQWQEIVSGSMRDLARCMETRLLVASLLMTMFAGIEKYVHNTGVCKAVFLQYLHTECIAFHGYSRVHGRVSSIQEHISV
jgi:hypothetical protein